MVRARIDVVSSLFLHMHAHPRTQINHKPRRPTRRTPAEHAGVWRRAFQNWRSSFDYDEFRRQGHPGLGRGLKRAGKEGEEEEEDGGLLDRLRGLSPETQAFFARKDEAERRLKELQVGCRVGWGGGVGPKLCVHQSIRAWSH